MTTREILHAAPGMLLTDGRIYCKAVYLAVGADTNAWTEVPVSDAPETEGEL